MQSITQNQLEGLLREALIKVYERHVNLGKYGLVRKRVNPFGETSLEGDWDAEETALNFFKENKVSITFITEEHGKVEFGRKFLGILDGLDGTNRYEAFMSGDRTARYGTMFAIYDGKNPMYSDYIVGGIMEHPTGRLVIASRGQGISLMYLSNGRQTPVNNPFKSGLDPKRIRADTYSAAKHFDFIKRTYIEKLPELNLESPQISLRSSAAHYLDFAIGEADWVLECTRKRNLEIIAAYPFVKERGGVMIYWDGRSVDELAPQRCLEFHSGPDDYVAVISAPNMDATLSLVNRLSK